MANLFNWNFTCPQTIWSSTKNLTSLAVAMLVDQGYLNFSDRFDIVSYGSNNKFWTSCFHRISQHWPEFGQCGKAGITVADMLRHEGGLSTIAAKLDIQDWWLSWSFKKIKRLIVPTNSFPENLRNNRVAQVLEKELPHWPEDCRREYHAITRGLIFFFISLIFSTWPVLDVMLKTEKVPWSRSCFAEWIPKAGPSDNFWGQCLTMATSNVVQDHHSHHHHLCKAGRNGWPSSHYREELLIDLEADVFIGLSEADQREKHIADLRAFPAAEVRTLCKYVVPVRNFILFNILRLHVEWLLGYKLILVNQPPVKN